MRLKSTMSWGPLPLWNYVQINKTDRYWSHSQANIQKAGFSLRAAGSYRGWYLASLFAIYVADSLGTGCSSWPWCIFAGCNRAWKVALLPNACGSRRSWLDDCRITTPQYHGEIHVNNSHEPSDSNHLRVGKPGGCIASCGCQFSYIKQ